MMNLFVELQCPSSGRTPVRTGGMAGVCALADFSMFVVSAPFRDVHSATQAGACERATGCWARLLGAPTPGGGGGPR